MRKVELNGQVVKYRLRPSKRAKKAFVRVKPNTGVELAYPAKSGRPPDPAAILREHADWILRTIADFDEARRRSASRTYESGEEFHFRGDPIRLEVEPWNINDEYNVGLEGDTLKLQTPAYVTTEGRRNMVIAWYRLQAKNYLPYRTRELAAQHGFRYGQLRIKHQKTRWGSCSAKGNLNLNLRLMQAPDDAIDYVILHELCHLRELNHSPAYWRLVAQHCPDYKHWLAWFKDNTHLMRL